MNNRLAKELAVVLRRKRSSLLLQEIAGSQNETETTLDDRESELEESAQKDRMTRLDSRLTERGQVLLRQIDDALERMDAGTFGECERCGNDISHGRLKAMPTAALCIECATAIEKRQRMLGMNGDVERLPFKDDELNSSLGSD
jgi:DnaK suppressor protein